MEDYTLRKYRGEVLARPRLNVPATDDGIIEQIVEEAARRSHRGGYTGLWTVREKQSGGWVPVAQKKNLLTNYGLTALVGAYAGSFSTPDYLIYDGTVSTSGFNSNIGDSTFYVINNPLLSGDTQITLGAGLAGQEVLTLSGAASIIVISSVTYTTFSTTTTATFAHTLGDAVCRTPQLTDTLISIPLEQQYDTVYNPANRAIATAGYSSGVGNFIMQFYLLASQANGLSGMGGWFGNVGTGDATAVGAGNLHNLYTLGYLHTNANDVEIDVVITIANS